MLKISPGRPASSRISPTFRAVSGVFSEGFNITALPDTIAGPILCAESVRGSLKEIISLAINDRITHEKEKLSLELSEGDRIAFLLPVSGG